MSSQADRNLLVGFLAVQLEFISADELVTAMQKCIVSQESMDTVLREASALAPAQQERLSALVGQYIDSGTGDAETSLAQITSLSPPPSASMESTGLAITQIPDGQVPDAELAEEATLSIATDESKQIKDVTLSIAADAPRQATDATLSIAANSSRPTNVEETISFAPQAVGDSRYHRLRPHARGGLGEVFVARDKELNREVALKEIQEQLADRQDLKARFIAEAEITGGLEHPGVVPVYGLGQYPDGRPYYAMRFIRGESVKQAIRTYHKQSDDSPDRRLEMRKLLGRFIDVCNTMEYAHSRGVLHRDLKPDNIMLGKYGETLVVDWGLAKSVDATESDSFIEEAPIEPSDAGGSATQMGAVVGTLAYMSPEQSLGRLDLIGPASDIYSLGATLYCILTGKSPLADTDLQSGLSRVRKGDFERPRSIKPTIPLPLDAICMKAMALRKEDRYLSPSALGEDIESWLADEPVTAMRESLVERSGRWLRKHKTAATAGLAASVMIAAVSIAAAIFIEGYRRESEGLAQVNRGLATTERAAREDADARRQEAEQKRQEADVARQQSEAVTGFLIDTFRSPAPDRSGDSITIAEMLARSAKQLAAGELAEDPLVRASLADAIGITYRGLALYRDAADSHQLAAELRTAVLGPTDRATLSSMNDQAMAQFSAGETEVARETFVRTLQLREETLGPKDFDTTASQINLATVFQYEGDMKSAIALFESALETREAILGPNHTDTLVALNNVAVAYRYADRIPEAVKLLEEALTRKRESLGPNHQSTVRAMFNLGDVYVLSNNLEEGIPLLRESLRLSKEIYSDDHPATLSVMDGLARALQSAKLWQEAIPLFEIVLAGRRTSLGLDHNLTRRSLETLATCFRESKQLPKALELLEEDYRLQQEASEDERGTLVSLMNLGWAYKLSGDLERANTLLQDAVSRCRTHLGDDDADTLKAMANLAQTLEARRNSEASLALYIEILALREARYGESHPETLLAMSALAVAWRKSQNFPESLHLLQRIVDIHEREFGEAAPSTMMAINNLGYSHKVAGNPEASIPISERAWQLRSEHLGASHPHTLLSLQNLGHAYQAAGDLPKAIEHIALAVELRTAIPGQVETRTLTAKHNLGRLYLATGDFEKCESIARQLIAVYRESQPRQRVVLATSLALLGTSMLRQKQFTEAEPILREVLSLRKITSKESWLLSNAQSLLGESLSGQKRFEEAEPLLVDGYEGLKKREHLIAASQRRDRIEESITRLVEFYDRWDKPDEAAAWKSKLSADE